MEKTEGPYMYRLMSTKRDNLVPYIEELCRCIKVKEYKVVSKSFIYLILEDESIKDNKVIFDFPKKFPSLAKLSGPNFVGHERFWVKWEDESEKRWETDYLKEYCTGDWISGKPGTKSHSSISDNNI